MTEEQTETLAEFRRQQAYYRRRVAALKNPAPFNIYGAREIPPGEAAARLFVAQHILGHLDRMIAGYEAYGGKTE